MLSRIPVREREADQAFLCGDVMTGRGIDQIPLQPCDPRRHQTYVEPAMDYGRLAEEAVGAISRPVDVACRRHPLF